MGGRTREVAVFFFSSRRRHTRCGRDWSSDVCSSDLELGLRWDESLRWWYADTDLDWRCRELGGVLAVPGPHPIHKHPSAQTFDSFELYAQAHQDEATFNAKWAGR